MKKAEKQNNPNKLIYSDVKSTLKVSVSITIYTKVCMYMIGWLAVLF